MDSLDSPIVYKQRNPQALPISPILPIGYFFTNEIPKLGQMFLMAFPFFKGLGQDFSYAIPLQGMTLSMEFLVSLSV